VHRKYRKILPPFVFVATIGLLLAGGCASTPPKQEIAAPESGAVSAPSRVKISCPVSGADATNAPEALRTEHKGKTYFFCCAGCKTEFEKNPEKYISRSDGTGDRK
jgi:YHS domain-containing protein